MDNLTPVKPSFVFGYWRPWKEDSNAIDSYLDYRKDVTLAKYSADIVGKYITQASSQQVNAINHLGQKIGLGLNVLSDQLSEVSQELAFINRNLDLQIEFQKVTNLLLQNINELLRVPDSEKARQHSIELGLKFFANAQKDDDLFEDALEEFLKAEELMKQDYFVLHRIGLIYLYSVNQINPQKALDYFARAAKYASVESDPKAARLANVLTKNNNSQNNLTDSDAIKLLAADSYEKAAFAAYVLGDFDLAVKNQSKALKYSQVPENYFLLAKYQTRTKEISECVTNLNTCIDQKPVLALAVFKDIDLVNEPEVIKVIEEKNKLIDTKITTLIAEWSKISSDTAKNAIKELQELSKATYDLKIENQKKFEKTIGEIKVHSSKLEKEINQLKETFQTTKLILSKNEIKTIIIKLDECLSQPMATMQQVFKECEEKFNNSLFKVGAQFGGGIIFVINEKEKHCLIGAPDIQVVSDYSKEARLLGDKTKNKIGATWGTEGLLGTSEFIFTGAANTQLIIKNASRQKGFLSSSPLITAATICSGLSLNGYNDWYLPSKSEARLLAYHCPSVLIKAKVKEFWTSSEVDSTSAFYYDKYGGEDSDGDCEKGKKSDLHSVWAIRSYFLE